MFDFRKIRLGYDPVGSIVKVILEDSPPRCAIVLDTRDNVLLQKVRIRIMNRHCDLRYRRLVFCLTEQDTVVKVKVKVNVKTTTGTTRLSGTTRPSRTVYLKSTKC